MKKNYLACFIIFMLMIIMLPMNTLAALPQGVPSVLEAPTMKSIELKYYESGAPYFEALVYLPQSVLNLDSEAPAGGSVFWEYAVKLDEGDWGDYGGGGYINVFTGGEDGETPVIATDFAVTFDPIDEGSLTSVDIKSHVYTYRLHVYYDYYEGWPDVDPIYSAVSNEVSIGTTAFYSDASAWAEPELKKSQRIRSDSKNTARSRSNQTHHTRGILRVGRAAL